MIFMHCLVMIILPVLTVVTVIYSKIIKTTENTIGYFPAEAIRAKKRDVKIPLTRLSYCYTRQFGMVKLKILLLSITDQSKCHKDHLKL